MKKKIIDSLVTIGAVKFGKFTLKSGIISPIYLDLRIIVSYPELLQNIATALIELAKDLKYDKIAGIPYTAMPIATAFSLSSGIPMIYARKEKKSYGTANQIEGIWQTEDQVLIIDDLITNGDSKLETFAVFQEAGLKTKDIVVLIDREQGGKQRMEDEGFQLFSLISVFEILDRMKESNQISDSKFTETREFLLNSNCR